jgi:hypothetical protein
MDAYDFNESRCVKEALEDRIEEACVAVIVEAAANISRRFYPSVTYFRGV